MSIDKLKPPVRKLARDERVRVSDVEQHGAKRLRLGSRMLAPILGVGDQLTCADSPELLDPVLDLHRVALALVIEKLGTSIAVLLVEVTFVLTISVVYATDAV